MLDWPEQRNALGPEEAVEVTEVLEDAAVADDVCGVVLAGNGAFCAGGNLKGMSERSGMSEDDRRTLVYGAFQGLIRAIVDVPVTTVAAIDGPAVGMGFDLALACDSRFVGPDGWCQQGWGKLGLIGGTGGELLLRLRAPGALWGLLEDQPRLDGNAMERLGLGEAVVDASARDRAVRRVDALAPMSRDAIEAYVDLYRSDLRARFDEYLVPRARPPGSSAEQPRFPGAGRPRPRMTFAGFELSDELQMLRDLVRRFVGEQLRPAEAALPTDARRLPDDVLADLRVRARAVGLWCMDAPAEYGGGGLSAFEAVVFWEEACKHRFCFPIAGGGAFGHSPPVVLYAGTPEQIDTWVRPAIAEGWTGFSAVAEPSGGTDPSRAIATTATPTADGWVLNGTKLWITHADHAQYGVVYARTEHGISTFVLSTAVPGLTARPIPTMRDSWPCELVLDDVLLPPDAIIGEEGQGLRLAGTWLTKGRLSYAARAVGVAEEAIRLAAEWARERQTFGAPLSTRQAIRIAFADSRMEVNSARWLTWEAAWLADEERPDARRAAAIAKVTATETGFRVVDRMMQVLGAMGLSRELPLESWFRDLRSARLIEGSSEILRDQIARDELG